GAAMLAIRQSGTRGLQQPVAPAEPATSDRGTELLEEARQLAQKGDIEGAHKKVLELAENAAERDDPAVKEIEDKWAQAVFAAGDATSDAAEKRRLLNELVATPTSSPQRRTDAAKRIEELDAQQPQPVRTARTTMGSPTGAPPPDPPPAAV